MIGKICLHKTNAYLGLCLFQCFQRISIVFHGLIGKTKGSKNILGRLVDM